MNKKLTECIDLFKCIKVGDLDLVKLYIESGSDIEIEKPHYEMKKEGYDILSYNDLTPCSFASYCNEIEITKLLVKQTNGEFSEDDEIALHYAVQNNNLELLEFLLEMGMNINSITSDMYYTPLHIALLENNLKIAKYLIDKGADIEKTYYNGLSFLYLLIKKELLNGKKRDEEVQREFLELFKYCLPIIDKSAYEEGEEMPFLHIVCRSAIYNNNEIFLEYCLQNGVGIDDAVFTIDNNNIVSSNMTLLHICVLYRNFKLIKFFLKKGANHSIKDAKNHYPVDYLFKEYIYFRDENKEKLSLDEYRELIRSLMPSEVSEQ